jgi:hypothetical protein
MILELHKYADDVDVKVYAVDWIVTGEQENHEDRP